MKEILCLLTFMIGCSPKPVDLVKAPMAVVAPVSTPEASPVPKKEVPKAEKKSTDTSPKKK